MSVDALGASGRARLIAEKIRELQTYALELEIMRIANEQDDDDVVPGLDADGSPLRYGSEIARVEKAIGALVDLVSDDPEALKQACDALVD